MSNHLIRDTAEQFLGLIETGAGSPEESERMLAILLDKLALEIWSIQFEFDNNAYPDPAPPPWLNNLEYARSHFPNLRAYRYVEDLSDLNNSAPADYRDPLDDIIDIASDLHEFLARWGNSPNDALWHLDFSHKHHWADHLRNLQLYLYSKRHGA